MSNSQSVIHAARPCYWCEPVSGSVILVQGMQSPDWFSLDAVHSVLASTTPQRSLWDHDWGTKTVRYPSTSSVAGSLSLVVWHCVAESCCCTVEFSTLSMDITFFFITHHLLRCLHSQSCGPGKWMMSHQLWARRHESDIHRPGQLIRLIIELQRTDISCTPPNQ